MDEISRIFVANRGEIAVRILKACRELGIESVLSVSEADRDSLAAKMADKVVCIGPPPAPAELSECRYDCHCGSRDRSRCYSSRIRFSCRAA